MFEPVPADDGAESADEGLRCLMSVEKREGREAEQVERRFHGEKGQRRNAIEKGEQVERRHECEGRID